MTQVDLGLTIVSGFDSADSVISVNDVNYKPGASQVCRGYEQGIRDEHDGRVAVLPRATNQAIKKGTFVHQVKYTKDIVRKFKMEDSKAMTTPMSTTTALDADEEGEHVDQKEYRSMIGSLLYLTATRPNIRFLVCLCPRFQPSPRTSHRQGVK
jgi:hypothetical protein